MSKLMVIIGIALLFSGCCPNKTIFEEEPKKCNDLSINLETGEVTIITPGTLSPNPRGSMNMSTGEFIGAGVPYPNK